MADGEASQLENALGWNERHYVSWTGDESLLEVLYLAEMTAGEVPMHADCVVQKVATVTPGLAAACTGSSQLPTPGEQLLVAQLEREFQVVEVQQEPQGSLPHLDVGDLPGPSLDALDAEDCLAVVAGAVEQVAQGLALAVAQGPPA